LKLPNWEQAYIQPQKLTGYLLSETHDVGRSKAKLLRAFGFNGENVAMLEQELLQITQTQEVQETIATPHGIKYVIDGMIQTPQGKSLQLRTVWIVDTGQTEPRFVTARPLKPAQEGIPDEPKA
jgi:hypothetical protein